MGWGQRRQAPRQGGDGAASVWRISPETAAATAANHSETKGSPMTNPITNVVRMEARHSISKVVDSAGRVWVHHDPLHLYRWISHRNALLLTVDTACRHARPVR
jgi:hypothetical protein